MVKKEELQAAIDHLKSEIQEELELKVTDLQTRLKCIEDENKRLNLRILELEKNQQTAKTPQLFSSLVQNKKSQLQVNETKILNAVSNESKVRISKEKNIAIFGLKKSRKEDKDEQNKEDLDNIQEIFDELNLDSSKIVRNFRLITKDETKPGIVIVELESNLYQQQVLQEAKNLDKVDKFKNKVYINPDLTIAERAALKLLLEERSKLNKMEKENQTPFRFIIRNGSLRKIQPKNLSQ
jgi:hypothetical protein